jgi:translation elongation factor EF-Tu-like GTPase
MCAVFVVRTSFTITGRGTCLTGFIRPGIVRPDDEVRWFKEGHPRVARCFCVSCIREVPLRDPPTIGLMVNGAVPDDFVEGMTFTLYR